MRKLHLLLSILPSWWHPAALKNPRQVTMAENPWWPPVPSNDKALPGFPTSKLGFHENHREVMGISLGDTTNKKNLGDHEGMKISDLVGGFNPSEKILASWDDYSQHMET